MPGGLIKPWVLALVLLFVARLDASELVKTNGEVLQGTVEDLPANNYIRIRTLDGKLFEIPRSEIRKLNGKEVSANGVAPGEVDWQDVPASAGPAPSKKEFWQKGWYLNLLEVGRTWHSYPSDTSAAMDTLRDLPGASSPGELSLQFAGIYWPLGAQRKTLLGFIIDGSGDPVFLGDKQWQLNQYIYSLSALYFPLGKIGDGLYVRGDIGAAALTMVAPGLGPALLDRARGFGFLMGLGYVLPTGDTLRPFVNLDYSLKSINSGIAGFIAQGLYQSADLNCGLLW